MEKTKISFEESMEEIRKRINAMMAVKKRQIKENDKQKDLQLLKENFLKSFGFQNISQVNKLKPIHVWPYELKPIPRVMGNSLMNGLPDDYLKGAYEEILSEHVASPTLTRILDVGPGKGHMVDVFVKHCSTLDLVEYYDEYYNQLLVKKASCLQIRNIFKEKIEEVFLKDHKYTLITMFFVAQKMNPIILHNVIEKLVCHLENRGRILILDSYVKDEGKEYDHIYQDNFWYARSENTWADSLTNHKWKTRVLKKYECIEKHLNLYEFILIEITNHLSSIMPKLEQYALHPEIQTFVIGKESIDKINLKTASDNPAPYTQKLYPMQIANPNSYAAFRLVESFSDVPQQHKGYIFLCACLQRNCGNQIYLSQMLKLLDSYSEDSKREVQEPSFVLMYITSSREFQLYELFITTIKEKSLYQQVMFSFMDADIFQDVQQNQSHDIKTKEDLLMREQMEQNHNNNAIKIQSLQSDNHKGVFLGLIDKDNDDDNCIIQTQAAIEQQKQIQENIEKQVKKEKIQRKGKVPKICMQFKSEHKNPKIHQKLQYCPVTACDFVNSYKQLKSHFESKHMKQNQPFDLQNYRLLKPLFLIYGQPPQDLLALQHELTKKYIFKKKPIQQTCSICFILKRRQEIAQDQCIEYSSPHSCTQHWSIKHFAPAGFIYRRSYFENLHYVFQQFVYDALIKQVNPQNPVEEFMSEDFTSFLNTLDKGHTKVTEKDWGWLEDIKGDLLINSEEISFEELQMDYEEIILAEIIEKKPKNRK